MKPLYILSLCLLTCHTLSATHIIGGSISYTHLGSNIYRIRLEVLRDCLNGAPEAPFDNPASIGVVRDGGLLHDLRIDFSGSDTLSINTTSSSCIVNATVCVEKAVYETEVYLPSTAGVLTLTYQRCCRSQILL